MRSRPIAVLAGAALLTAALGATAAAQRGADPTGRVAPQKVTAAGVGAVKVGARFATLRERGLVGPLRPGCEVAGPDARGAQLRAPLEGAVDLTQNAARRVRTIAVTGGATARGVGIGDTRGEIRSAFPTVRFDHSTEEVFGLTLAKVPRNGGGRIQFGIGTESKRVTLIGVPFIPFCD